MTASEDYSVLLNVNYIMILKAFFISNTFISNARLKLGKNQANAKQHSGPELLLFEDFSNSSSMLS